MPNCWGSLCGWYSKTNISRIPITQTDTPHVDLQAPRQARRPAPECSAKRHHPPTQTREHEADPLVQWVARERATHPSAESAAAILRRAGRRPCQSPGDQQLRTPRVGQLFGSQGWKQSTDPNCSQTWLSKISYALVSLSGAALWYRSRHAALTRPPTRPRPIRPGADHRRPS